MPRRRLLLTFPSTSFQPQSQTCPPELGNPGHLLETPEEATRGFAAKHVRSAVLSFHLNSVLQIHTNCRFPKLLLIIHFTVKQQKIYVTI